MAENGVLKTQLDNGLTVVLKEMHHGKHIPLKPWLHQPHHAITTLARPGRASSERGAIGLLRQAQGGGRANGRRVPQQLLRFGLEAMQPGQYLLDGRGAKSESERACCNDEH